MTTSNSRERGLFRVFQIVPKEVSAIILSYLNQPTFDIKLKKKVNSHTSGQIVKLVVKITFPVIGELFNTYTHTYEMYICCISDHVKRVLQFIESLESGRKDRLYLQSVWNDLLHREQPYALAHYYSPHTATKVCLLEIEKDFLSIKTYDAVHYEYFYEDEGSPLTSGIDAVRTEPEITSSIAIPLNSKNKKALIWCLHEIVNIAKHF